MAKKITDIEQLFKLAGGTVHIAALLNINQWTVDRWRNSGIPQKHWGKLSVKYGLDAETLYQISMGCKDDDEQR